MAEGCLLYYITDRKAFVGNENARRERLLAKIREAVLADIDYIQLREKDLSTRELEYFSRDVVRAIAEVKSTESRPRTKLFINSRADVALAVEADGVHLRSDDVSAKEVKAMWHKWAAGTSAPRSRESPLIGVSCHSPEEVAWAQEAGATFAVFAPVFEKKDLPATAPKGLASLRKATEVQIPVLALGGITVANAQSCLEAGAAGIAAIRLFQENDISEVVHHLRRGVRTN